MELQSPSSKCRYLDDWSLYLKSWPWWNQCMICGVFQWNEGFILCVFWYKCKQFFQGFKCSSTNSCLYPNRRNVLFNLFSLTISYGIAAFIESKEQFLGCFCSFQSTFIQLKTIKWSVDQDCYPTYLIMVILHYADFQNTCSEVVCFSLVSLLTIFHLIPVIPLSC